MNKLFDLVVARLKPWQILTVGAAVLLAAVALVLFGLCPLVAALFAPLGPTAVAVAGLVASIGGGCAIYLTIPKFFARAYLVRKVDDAFSTLISDWKAAKDADRA